MKKFLLSLMCFAAISTVAYADEVTVTTSALGYANAEDVTDVKANDDITLTFAKGKGSNGPKYYNTGTAIRMYPNNTMTVTGSGVNITKVVITTGSSNKINEASTVTAGTLAFEGAVCTWTGNVPEFTLTQGGTSGHARLNTIAITYEAGTPVAVKAPVIAMGENNTVVITAEEGAEIHYTVDETEPTAASALYTAPIAITAKTTVKAVAVKGADVSKVASFEAVPNVVANIAAFIANANTNDTKINAPVTVLYQNGRNLYLKDAADSYILAYNNNDVAGIAGAYKNGDVLVSITGAYKSQNGLPELIPSAVGEKSEGTAVEPTEYALDELSTSMLNQYVKVSGLNITAAASANNYTATDADGNKIAIYNTFYNASYYNVVDVPEGTDMTVTGFVSCYNSTLQLTPISVEGKALVHVETPVFTPESGAVKAGTVVTIATATEGAAIYYTIDGTEPTAESKLYAEGITVSEAMTIKAIAVKEGMLNSEVATATYSIAIEGGKTAMFNFSEPASLTPAQAAPEAGKATELDGITLTAGPISMTMDKGTNTNVPRLWNPTGTYTGQVDFRVYGNNILTFTGTNAKIATITFNPRNTTSKWGAFTTETKGEWTANGQINTFTLAEAETTVVLTGSATSNIGSIEVVYVDAVTTGITEVEADNANATVEYYNIQGMRVNADSLTPGLYIRHQGRNAVKIYVK